MSDAIKAVREVLLKISPKQLEEVARRLEIYRLTRQLTSDVRQSGNNPTTDDFVGWMSDAVIDLAFEDEDGEIKDRRNLNLLSQLL